MKKRVGIAFGLALGLIGIFIIAVGWEDVLSTVYRTSPVVYSVAFASTLGCLLCRTVVWHRVLAIVDKPRPYWLISGVFLTAMFTKYVVPYGQVTSGVGIAAVVSRYYETEYEEALAGVVSADFLNYVPYYSFGLLGGGYVLLIHAPPISLTTYAAPIVLLIGIIGVLLGVLWFRRRVVLGVVLKVTTAVNKHLLKRLLGRELTILHRENVERRFQGFFTTLDLVSKDKHAVWIALLFAHLGWMGLAGALYFSALALDQPLSIGLAFFAVAISKLGFVVPTPGGVGGVEFTLASALYLLTPLGFATTTAIALLWRVSTYWFTVLLGGGTAIAVTIKDPLPPEAE